MVHTSTVLLPDTQIPYQDKSYVRALVQFVKDYQPKTLAHVGDHLDAPEPSRWNKGMAGEYAPTLQASIDEAHDVFRRFREVHEGEFHFKLGNHDERVETYVRRYAPALSTLDALSIDRLLRLDEIDVTMHRGLYDITPGWVLAHLHEGGMSRIAGSTAMALARKVGKSVVGGHTHKAGIQAEAHGYNGKVRHLFGMEVGHAMDMKKAGYLKYGGAAWTQAFGILHTDGRNTWPQLVIVQGRKFVVDGVTYAF